MVHMSKLFISLNQHVPVRAFGTTTSKMIRQMPRLQLFAFMDYVKDDKTLDIVCRATAVATFQNKKVWITTFNLEKSKFSCDSDAHITEIKIQRKQNEYDLGSETLNIRLRNFGYALDNLEGYLDTHLEVNSLTFQVSLILPQSM